MNHKLLLTLGVIFLLGHSGQAQTSATAHPPVNKAVYTYVEQMPAFPGGQQALFQAIGQTIVYPTEALQQRLEGRVFVQFVVGTSGNVEDVKVSKSLHPLLDAEAIRAVSELPAFLPGRHAGRAVPVAFTLPITFKIPQNVEEILAARATNNASGRLANFPGGPIALQDYLSNLPIPADYQPNSDSKTVTPRVFVTFDVDSIGRVTNAHAVQPIPLEEQRRLNQNAKVPPHSPVLLASALNRISTMPAWEPAVSQGKRVSTHHTEAITFGPARPALSYADEMPIFLDTNNELQYIGMHMRYPVASLRSRTQGEALTYYEISEEGKVEHIEIIRSVSPDIDAEVRRVVQTLPSYKAARHQGKPVRVFYVLPITFRML